ncbi:hypothetical protein [Macrococcus carouselicus]|nr:hypothetical protein [Macrococcus carouselicus]
MHHLKQRARQMKKLMTVLYFAAQHPTMPFSVNKIKEPVIS